MTDPTADWQEWPTDVDCREQEWARHMMQCYRQRLRDTAEALRDALDEFVRIPYGASQEDVAYIRDFETRASAILARLEKEGLA